MLFLYELWCMGELIRMLGCEERDSITLKQSLLKFMVVNKFYIQSLSLNMKEGNMWVMGAKMQKWEKYEKITYIQQI